MPIIYSQLITSKFTDSGFVQLNQYNKIDLDVLPTGNTSESVSIGDHTHSELENSTQINTPNTLVLRDANGDFSAGTITAELNGNSSSSTKLETAKLISLIGDVNGSILFDGSENISIDTTIVNYSHSHDFANITNKPTTLSGYGITDAASSSHTHSITDVEQLNSILNNKIETTEKGIPNGVATLDGNGLVLSSQLPSYVDDVLEFANLASLPTTGESNKIYITIDDNKIYRWSGTIYIEISSTAGNTDTATKLATARTISLTGDVTGSTTFDGSTNVTITANIEDYSHNHIISNVDGLQTVLDNKSNVNHNHTLNGLSDTVITSNTNGEILKWNGTSWVNNTLAEAGIQPAGSYLTSNQTITVSGDATGSGTTSLSLTLANSGVTAGTYNNSATANIPLTVDSKGRITGTGAAVTITPAWSSITSKPTTLSGYGITDAANSSHNHDASNITSGTISTARLGSGTANSTTFLRGDNTWQTISTGTSVTITNDTTTNSTYYPTFTTTTSGTASTINTSNSKLTFNPSTGILSSTQFNALSDISVKTNIASIENNIIDKINQLNPVSFNWKDNPDQKSYGVIAQELENIFPELVNTNQDTGLKTVNYDALIGILIKAVQILSSKN